MVNDFDFFVSSELLIVILKVWQVLNVVKYLVGILLDIMLILLVYNGMGIVEELCGVKQLLLLVFMIQVVWCDGNVIIYVVQGIMYIGLVKSYEGDYSYFVEVLQSVLLDVVWYNNIYLVIWCKLVVNCVINFLIVFKGCKNGDLCDYMQEVVVICCEVVVVMECEGIYILVENLLFYVEQVIESMVENIFFMLQDVCVQWYIEIDYIIGFLFNCVCVYGVVVLENVCLFELIKCKENEYECVGIDLFCFWQ